MINEIKNGQLFFDCKKCKLKIPYEEAWDMECGQCSMDDWQLKKVKFVNMKSLLEEE